MDLIQLSKNKNFISRDRLIAVNTEYYYLWMCELQRWLRDVHNIYIFINSTRISDNKRNYEYNIQQNKDLQPIFDKDKILTYEQALEEGLYEALKLIKSN